MPRNISICSADNCAILGSLSMKSLNSSYLRRIFQLKIQRGRSFTYLWKHTICVEINLFEDVAEGSKESLVAVQLEV